MASKAIGFLNFKFGADLKGFDRAMKKAQKNLKRFGKNVERTGKSLTTGLTLPILALGAASVKAFDEQAKAETKLLTALKGREDIQKRLIEQAKELQKTTLFGDEATIESQALLASLGLTEEQILMLMPQIQNMAQALGTDLKSATSLVSKSVSTTTDALARYFNTGLKGVTGQQERAIVLTKSLTEKFDGQAEAAAKIGAGPLVQMTNQLGDLAEELGMRLMPYVNQFVVFMKQLIKKFDELTNSQKENVVKWGLWVAALGPALIIIGKISIGISSLIKMFVTLRTVTLLASTSFTFFRRSMIRMTAAGWAANGMIGAMTGAFRVLKTAIMTNPIGVLIGTLALAAGAFLTYTQATKDATDANDEFEGTVETTEEAIKRIGKSVGDMGKDSFQLQIQEIEDLIKKIKGFEIKPSQFTKGVALSDKQKKQIQDLNMLLIRLKQKQFEAKKETDDLNQSINNLGNETEDTTEEIEKYTRALDPLIENINKYSEAYRVLGADMQDVDIWTLKLTESQQIAKAGWMMFGDVLTSSLDSALSSQENFFDAFVKNIKRAIQSLLVQLAVMTLISAIMPASLGGIGKAAFSSKNILGNLATLMNIPAMADGGVVMGPQMALIGEAGPEAVIPLDQLKNFGGAQQVEVVGKISGTDIFLSNRNTGTNRQRSV